MKMSRRDYVIGGSFVAVMTMAVCMYAWAQFETMEADRQRQRAQKAYEIVDVLHARPPVVDRSAADLLAQQVAQLQETVVDEQQANADCERRIVELGILLRPQIQDCAGSSALPQAICMRPFFETYDNKLAGQVDVAFHFRDSGWKKMGPLDLGSGMGAPPIGLHLEEGECRFLLNAGGNSRYEGMRRIANRNGVMSYAWSSADPPNLSVGVGATVCAIVDWEKLE